MDKKRIRELCALGQSMKPTLMIGKEKVTDKVTEELARQLAKFKLVKLKVLPSSTLDTETVCAELAAATSSSLIETRGRTALLYKD
ncbi:MAG TPA: YhbY family RNA-binding protein [Thermoplasmata archaeon]